MIKSIVMFTGLLLGLSLFTSGGLASSYPIFDHQTALDHEIKPHRRVVPVVGMDQEEYKGEHLLNLKLTVSPRGDVIHAETRGESEDTRFWPQIEGEISRWRFTPFLKNGKAVTADVDEIVVLVPPERLPKTHVAPPPITKDSKVAITLRREWCDGTCDIHTVTVSQDGVVFWGWHGVADGKHTGEIDKEALRVLANSFAAGDFYSMEDSYCGFPPFRSSLSITVDGRTKTVKDCVGEWVGMPSVILELEDEVDAAARTNRWIVGGEGLVAALRAENFAFATYDAQRILENASVAGQTATVRELLAAGVPIKPLAAPKMDNPYGSPFEEVQLLTAAGAHPDTLQVFLDIGVSKDDQKDKDLALDFAALAGQLNAVRALIAYGANPNAGLSTTRIVTVDANVILGPEGPGSILIDAARSGNPEVVKEILRYGPALETRDRKGKTALFIAGESTRSGEDEGRAECVRMLAKAGASVDARDQYGNTLLHKTSLVDVQEELVRLGAAVNARNLNGETPIFTNPNVQVLSLLLQHGADLTLRNNQGDTVVSAPIGRGSDWDEALRKAAAADRDLQ